MRVMLIIKGDPQPGAAPSEELLGAIGRYNDELCFAVPDRMPLSIRGSMHHPRCDEQGGLPTGGLPEAHGGKFGQSARICDECLDLCWTSGPAPGLPSTASTRPLTTTVTGGGYMAGNLPAPRSACFSPSSSIGADP